VENEPPKLVDELYSAMLAVLPTYTRLPIATYRVQLNHTFGFQAAKAIVPYLDSLGISDLYTSPCLKAQSGSLHGYDVVDHGQLNPELGRPEDYSELAAALRERGMGHLLDFVPNHMAIGPENPLWMDVLENGPSSIYAYFFDIDWDPIREDLHNKVLLPILGDQYGAVLERGELVLTFENGGFHIDYYEHRFPVAPRQYTQILNYRLDELQRAMPPGDVAFEDLLSIITALGNLPPSHETDQARIAERNREKESIKRRIVALCESSPQIEAFIRENVRIFNGTPGDPHSFDLLDALLRSQSYRLAYWRVAAEEINYRRFFDINNLAAIRMEDPRVLRHTHALVFSLIADRKVTGMRIDHPDGLYCPADYFEGLQEELAMTLCRRLFLERRPGAAEGAIDEEWATLEPALRERYRADAARGPDSPVFRPLYVVVEKILANQENIPPGWAVHGTTGYDFMNAVNSVQVDERNVRAIDETFARFTGLDLSYAELVYQKRRQTMGDSMSSELNMLARQLSRISEHDRRTRDFTLNSLRRALMEVIACFPVYRTYRASDGAPADEHDRGAVEAALRLARRRNPTINASIFNFIREVLLGIGDGRITEEAVAERLQFVLKLQQFTSPVMAKSVEDTAFYIYNRLVSLNEVGGEPDEFGISVEDFHERNEERASCWPAALIGSTTHDTKRSEDVRARINVLSEIPGEWKKRLSVWSRLNRRFKQNVGDLLAPDRNEEILLYQTLIGTWPFGELEGERFEAYRARIQAYMQKAVKEAKVNTGWFNPHEEWERAVALFIDSILDSRLSERFWRDFVPFQKRVALAGAYNSLAQLVLKLASPGVADIYQGNELWDFSLVDPDNRRPVDFELRARLLAELDARLPEGRQALAEELHASFEDGRIKLFVTSQGLRLRRRFPELLRDGRYLPLVIRGERSLHAIGLARRNGEQSAVAVVPRLLAELLERFGSPCEERLWADTFVRVPFAMPGKRFVEVFTGRRLELAEHEGYTGFFLRDTFSRFPVFLAIPEEQAEAGQS
jgi:(1->4)-alpha-D-glucan 1-alpha-D-glucosylmutase